MTAKRNPPPPKAPGRNISENERHTRRLRIPRETHEQAERLAKRWECTVAEAVAEAVMLAATTP